jgi:predicted RNase H-like nuclease (RuvC/YqgF family)
MKTRAEQVMNRLNVEYLLGHPVGLNANYYKPTEQELLEDYLKAVPALTINEDIPNIKKQQEILEQREQKQEEEIQRLKQEHSEQLKKIIEYFTGELQTVNKTFEAKVTEFAKIQERINKMEEEMDKGLREREEKQKRQQKHNSPKKCVRAIHAITQSGGG